MAGLLIGGGEHGVGYRPIKFKLADGQRRQLPLAKSGEYQRLVDQLSLSTPVFQLGDEVRPLGESLPPLRFGI